MLLFADEPTTHLDTVHIEWLEKKMQDWQGAFVVVSHDRAFLDAVCTTIWAIEDGVLDEQCQQLVVEKKKLLAKK